MRRPGAAKLRERRLRRQMESARWVAQPRTRHRCPRRAPNADVVLVNCLLVQVTAFAGQAPRCLGLETGSVERPRRYVGALGCAVGQAGDRVFQETGAQWVQVWWTGYPACPNGARSGRLGVVGQADDRVFRGTGAQWVQV
jgi:hypothetical protein